MIRFHVLLILTMPLLNSIINLKYMKGKGIRRYENVIHLKNF